MDPSRRCAGAFDSMNFEVVQAEYADLCIVPISLVGITQASKDHDRFVNERGCMEIRRREIGFSVTVKIYGSVGMDDHDIIVDIKIRIIMILVFTSDINGTTIRQLRDGLPKTIEAPRWTFSER